MLQLDDGPHGDSKGVTAHLHGLDKALGSIHLFLYIEQSFFSLTAQMVLVLLIFLHGVGKRLRHFKFRHLAIVERKGNSTIILSIDDKVGRYLLHTSAHCLTKRGTRTGIQLSQLLKKYLCLGIVERQRGLNLIPMLLGKRLEIVAHHLLHQVPKARRVTTCYLQLETFLQRTGTNAGRVETLQKGKHAFYL